MKNKYPAEETNQLIDVLQICQGYTGPFMDCARQYAALFDKNKYRVTTIFLTGSENKSVSKSVASNEVIYFDYHRDNLEGLKLGIISRLKQFVVTRDFKLCIAHRTKPTYLALLATQLPVISIHHAMHDFDKFGRRLFVKFFQKRLTILGVSNAVRDDIRGKLSNWPSSKIQTLYNRIDLDSLRQSQLDREEARAKLSLPQHKKIIGNVGRLHPDKDQETLIKAFAKALKRLEEPTILVIVGEGKLEKKLKELCQDLGIENHVVFTGQIPEAKRYFAAFDMFVLSSDHEPFGMVLLEAMAAGVPVACTDCGGGAEVVKGVGRLFPLGDSKKLSEILIDAIHSQPEQNSMLIDDYVKKHFTDEAAKERFFNLVDINSL